MNLKRVLALFCVCFLLIGLPIKSLAEDETKDHVILIDAGHGGIDGGAKSKNGTIEKDINLSIAKKLKTSLEENGYKVYMTREEDNELDKKKARDLSYRCQMKRDTKCEIFVSIHQNMFPQGKCFGSQVWYSENEDSKVLAERVQESLKNNIDDKNKRIAKPAKDMYKILRDKYDGACILVECGFLSNYEEEQRLKTDEHQDKIVKGIQEGIDEYFKLKNEQ